MSWPLAYFRDMSMRSAGPRLHGDPRPARNSYPAAARGWLARYRAGEHVQVWREMREAGEAVRDTGVAEHARAVAAETMTRVRRNVEAVRDRLAEAGYRFHVADEEVHVPPTSDTPAELDEFETVHGLLPLSLRAFYEVVGTVDLCQAWDQLVHWRGDEERAGIDDLLLAGEYDPLVVRALPLAPGPWVVRADGGWFFAPDEFHKANYSGGDNYHVLLPDAGADFQIDGMYDIDEWFVDHLRAVFAGGGFRGRCDFDEERAWKMVPDLELFRVLAEGLRPF
jgi:hypothetical protein